MRTGGQWLLKAKPKPLPLSVLLPTIAVLVQFVTALLQPKLSRSWAQSQFSSVSLCLFKCHGANYQPIIYQAFCCTRCPSGRFMCNWDLFWPHLLVWCSHYAHIWLWHFVLISHWAGILFYYVFCFTTIINIWLFRIGMAFKKSTLDLRIHILSRWNELEISMMKHLFFLGFPWPFQAEAFECTQ